MWDYFKREWWKSKEYSAAEVTMMSEIYRCFRESQCGKNEPPELKMGNNKMPEHEISSQDLLPSVWNDKLEDGFLSTEVQDMISDCTEYMSLRVDANVGNPNDPTNLTCYELLIWMTRDLSGAKCNEATLNMVDNRIQYLIKLGDAKIFKNEKTRRTMLSVITSVRTTLQHKIRPIINREIENSCVRDYLTELKKLGKRVSDYGFQFLYFALRDTIKPSPADICLLPDEITESRSGLLLQCLVKTPSYCHIFDTKDPSATEPMSIEDKPQSENTTTLVNPFIDQKNQLCIPQSLFEDDKHTAGLFDYLNGKSRGAVKKTGLLEAFRTDEKLLSDFMEMHALLIELAQIFLACDEAYKSAGQGGDLLVYGQSNKQINDLMETLKKLCKTLTGCHNRIKMATSNQEAIETGKTVASLPKATRAWLKNLARLPSINDQLESALSSCIDEANKIQTSSNKITTEERLEIAKKQTLYFTETAEILSNHVTQFLTRQPMLELPSSVSPRSRSVSGSRFFPESPPPIRSPVDASTSAQQLATIPRGRALTFTMGARPSPNTPHQSAALSPDVSDIKPSQDVSKLDLRGNSKRVFTDNLINCAVQLIKSRKQTFTKVQLKNNKLTSNRTKALWKALAECSSLTKLNVTNNPSLLIIRDFSGIQMESLNAFSDFIKTTKTLKVLHINRCGIDTKSAGFIASCLSFNQTLEVLDLGGNPLGDLGIEAICVALQKNKILYDLRLNYINISDQGARHILDLLKVSTQITDLMLDDEKISQEMKGKIGQQLYHNRQLLLDQQNPYKVSGTKLL